MIAHFLEKKSYQTESQPKRQYSSQNLNLKFKSNITEIPKINRIQ